ncbi:MAG: phosphoenolpyruvate--protein phosphotransferase [Kofleriaceae bacterium]|jgi:phosphotransferase system enzyme I (PtsI)|nr:phosphoenolpyruvate--protein phosphotransferase [Kofleriaceae bacterium]MBP9170781.1 phosphoenolpyruvate--protein phosphotransferase [Kofleriaceae bacterium]MBP9857704.1 phosphoenolpyruvate--protein phosphotransferase [Kofleriaceae bacterium]
MHERDRDRESSGERPVGELRKAGVAVSAGIAIGRAFLVGRDLIKEPRYHVEADDVDAEVARLRKAIASSDRQLEKIKSKLAEEEASSDFHIITAHQLMLHDEHLVDATIGYIKDELINAEWALHKAVGDIRGVFDAIDDDYFRERRSDIDFVGERVLRNLLGKDTGPLKPPPDAIVVAYDLSPADTAQLHKHAVAGLITDAGGKTSHTAIIARAHELPAVVGLEDITEVVLDDDLLIVDGAAGVVIVNPTPATVGQYRDQQRKQVALEEQLLGNRDLPAVTRDGVAVQLYANIDGPDEIDGALEHGAVGIGLYRTEYLFMVGEQIPDEETHYRTAVEVLERMAGRPVTMRTFDLGADKLAKFLEEAALDEVNPALGLRSIRLCLADLGLALFRAQLRGLLRASAHGPLRIMFPMISGVGELRSAMAVLDDVKAELRAEGLPFDEGLKVGIMIEMPASAMIADLLAKECAFFSIGTNDLIQYTMAVDRVNELVSYLYEPLHPALLRLLRDTAAAARGAGIPVSICGEMAADALVAPVLLGLGLTELSMSAVAIPEVKGVVRATTMADLADLIDELLSLPTALEIRAAVTSFTARLGVQLGGPR